MDHARLDIIPDGLSVTDAPSRARKLSTTVLGGHAPLAERETEELGKSARSAAAKTFREAAFLRKAVREAASSLHSDIGTALVRTQAMRDGQRDDADRWPAEFVYILQGNIQQDDDKQALGRPEVRANLAKIYHAANTLLQQLSSQPQPDSKDGKPRPPRPISMRAFLMSDTGADVPRMQELIDCLPSLAKRAKEKLDSLPTSKGGDKPKPTAVARIYPKVRIVCALMVVLLHESRTGRPPSAKNTEAWSDCAQLFKKAGGKPKGNTRLAPENRDHGSWEENLRDARNLWMKTELAESLRGVIRREARRLVDGETLRRIENEFLRGVG